jgi:kumamolisin
MPKRDLRLVPSRHVRVTETTVSPEAPYTVHDLTRFYNLPQKLDGRGQKLGILLPGGGLTSGDLKTYFETLDLPQPEVSVLEVQGAKNEPARHEDLKRFLLSIGAGYEGPPRAPYRAPQHAQRAFPEDMQPGSALFDRVTWTYEALCDVEIAGGIAPGAELRVYVCENTGPGILAAIEHAARDRVASINGSWGWSERSDLGREFVADVNRALKEAAEHGITCCFASGDSGSRPGFETGDDRLAVYFPASSPHALACGGTKISDASGKHAKPASSHGGPARPTWIETVWNEADFTFDGASGGGFSELNARPEWQAGSSFAAYPKKGRAVPDVAGNAAGSSGVWLWIAGLNTVSFGTSAASPFWAGLIARLSQGIGARRFLVPSLYAPRVRKTFRDVISGSNAKPGLGDEYAARPGWDPCTGLGTPDGEALLAALTDAPEASILSDSQTHEEGDDSMAKREIVKDDLLIATEDGKIYYIPEKDWKKATVGAEEAGWLKEELLSRGVTLAAIPESVSNASGKSASKGSHQASSHSASSHSASSHSASSHHEHKHDGDAGEPGGALIACYLVNLSGLRQSNPFEKK